MKDDHDHCSGELVSVLIQKIYDTKAGKFRKSHVGKVVICIDLNAAENDLAIPDSYSMKTIIYGECPGHRNHRYLGYDTAHDQDHETHYGPCHKHECAKTLTHSPCDYPSVKSLFLSETDNELQSRGYRRGRP